MAKSYQNLMGQISKLQEQAAAVRKKEMSGVVAGIHKQMAEYGLTAEDLGFSAGRGAGKGSGKAASKASTRAGVGVPKYQDPVSGKTWTGMGKPPTWIVGAANRDDFLINKAGGGVVKAGSPRKSAAVNVGVPKYQDPNTGATWTGRGKPPNWIAGVANRDEYLIAKSGAAAKPAANTGQTKAKVKAKVKTAASPVSAKKAVERTRRGGAAKKATAGRKGGAVRGRKSGRGAAPVEAAAQA